MTGVVTLTMLLMITLFFPEKTVHPLADFILDWWERRKIK